jgi:hypothetical protein
MNKIFSWFIWMITGYPLYLAGVSAGTAAAVAAAASVAAAGVQAGTSAAAAGSSKKAAAAAGKAAEAADKRQLTAAQESYNARLREVENANRIMGGTYDVARPELNQGYDQSNAILGQTYGQPGTAYRAASGTSPEQLNQLNTEKNRLLAQYQQAQTQADGIMNTLKTQPMPLQQLLQMQEQYNVELRKQQALQPKLDQIDATIKNAAPYVPGQEASIGFNDNYNYAGGTDAGKRYTTEDVRKWLADNPGLSDEKIMLAMQQYGISTAQLAAASGVSENDINTRISTVQQSKQGTAPQALKTGANQAQDYLNAGYDAAGNIVNAGYDAAGNYINAGYDAFGNYVNEGYDAAGNVINQGFDQAIGTQQPYYDTGTRALGSMEKMITNGNEYLPQDPGYQFRLDQGNKAINNSAAAKGGLLSGATLKAISQYNSGQASQEFQNAFSRWNELATKGQQAANTISGLQSNRGQILGQNETQRGQLLGTGEADRGTSLASNSTARAGLLSGQATERGMNLASNASNLGNNLSSLYQNYGNMTSNNALDRARTNADLTLQEGQYYATNALGNADAYANTVGAAGKESANLIQQAGNARAAGILGSSNAINQGIVGATNTLTQGLNLYSGQAQQKKQDDLYSDRTNALRNLYRNQ